MSRLWSRVGVRASSIALLLTGVAGGFYLGHDRDVQQQSVEARLVRVDADEMETLKERHNEHAAARASQRAAEAQAAAKAAREAKAAASRARKVEAAAIRKVQREKAERNEESAGPAKPYTGPIPDSCDEYSGNREVGCALMLARGFKLDQFPCLDKLWKKESGWNHKARNPSSGAYGIAQALPGSKMKSAGADWRTNPATQIKWGLGYIKGRYGKPCGAWAHSQNRGWY